MRLVALLAVEFTVLRDLVAERGTLAKTCAHRKRFMSGLKPLSYPRPLASLAFRLHPVGWNRAPPVVYSVVSQLRGAHGQRGR